MNRKKLYSLAALGALFTLVTASPQAQAQRGGRFGGMMGGPGMFRLVEPTVSNTAQLLQRADVQTEISLSARQREQLASAQDEMRADMGKRIRENMPDFSKLKDLSAEERKAEQEKLRSQMQDNVQSALSDSTTAMDKKLGSILRPEQYKRLKELDLQWRGPLAIGDKKVGDPLNLTEEQKPKLQELVAEYTKGRNEALQSAFAGIGNPGGRRNRPNGNASDPNVPAPPAAPQDPAAGGGRTPIDPADIEKRMTEAQIEVDKVRASIGDKVVAMLTPEQAAAWKTMAGKKFIFRKSE